jgi:hypothetical protein
MIQLIAHFSTANLSITAPLLPNINRKPKSNIIFNYFILCTPPGCQTRQTVTQAALKSAVSTGQTTKPVKDRFFSSPPDCQSQHHSSSVAVFQAVRSASA